MQTNVIRVRELTVRYTVRELPVAYPVALGSRLSTPSDAANLLTPILEDEPGEVLVMLCLDIKYRAIAFHEVSRGTLDGTCAHPRDVFRAALLSNAANVIVAHNHPSGDPSPSVPDVQLTRRLCEAGDMIGIRLVDHIITGDRGYFSFRESNLLTV